MVALRQSDLPASDVKERCGVPEPPNGAVSKNTPEMAEQLGRLEVRREEPPPVQRGAAWFPGWRLPALCFVVLTLCG